MQIDGVNTQGENIADNGGIKQAFRVISFLKIINKNKFKFFELKYLYLFAGI